MRVQIDRRPYLDSAAQKNIWLRGEWPCFWIGYPEFVETPFVMAYRKRFTLEHATIIRAHVTADERYELFLDGARIGRGSERGDRHNWFFETYDFHCAAGEHVLVARVWSHGDMAAAAQMTARPGFLLSPESEEFVSLLGTGVASWQVKKLEGYTFRPSRIEPHYVVVAPNATVDGNRFSWGFEQGEGEGWREARVLDRALNASEAPQLPPYQLPTPATLPPMLEIERVVGIARSVAAIETAIATSESSTPVAVRAQDHLPDEAQAWNALLQHGAALVVPAHTRRRVVVDLEDYYCAYPEWTLSGGSGSALRLHWAESLFCEPEGTHKGNRNEIEGKYFVGMGDTFLPDGSAKRRFDTLWWQCGRYLEIIVQTEEEPLSIDGFRLRETRYPLSMESEFSADDDNVMRVVPVAVRAMQMCSHETYMDCPYYEQLMYAGDTRLEVLTNYVLTRDDRLPRKALRMFDASRMQSGLTQSRYPSRVTHLIPPFSLWWAAMVHDYALWRDDRDFVRGLMPGVRGVLDAFRGFCNRDGLVQITTGWNFTDWVEIWNFGMPPGADHGVSGIINWQFAHVLGLVAQVEEWLGEPEQAMRTLRTASELAQRIQHHFWDEKRGLFADDLDKQHFSEHAQCLAILSDQLDAAQQERVVRGLLQSSDLAPASIYFSHYLFETFTRMNRIDALFERLKLWFDLDKNGFKTTFEEPEPSRSDCHAWGAHPLYHYFASILGIRPAAMGFNSVRIAPQLGSLSHASGKLVHPKGDIEVDLRVDGKTTSCSISLPPNVAGTFVLNGLTQALHPGRQDIVA